MRIVAVTVNNVGGLADGRVLLPEGPIAAFAGANGTGKSKLLACILSPWTGQIPTPRKGATADASVEMQLSEAERAAIADFGEQMGWGVVSIPENVEVSVTRSDLVGARRASVPNSTVLDNLWSHQAFLSSVPSLNVVYLPAERRLLEPRQAGIDLSQLTEIVSFQKTADSRNAVNNYGRLDDQEFEDFAKALCVAASLPSDGLATKEEPARETVVGATWEEFRETVDALIAPKKLVGLTREHPDQLRVLTPSRDLHLVRDLSSGERQALIIMSRVLRAGTHTPIVLIDEPDAYLHPHLSRRLILALEDGVGSDGQLIVATHSPSILDGVPPLAILRLEHGGPPRPVADETERLDLYRAAGFRSSALTQADFLLITEGKTDQSLLTLAIPELSSASVQSAGGKAEVLRGVQQLLPYDLPVLGVVDQDLGIDPIPDGLEDCVFVWPTADIEGVFLSDEHALQVMLENGLIKDAYSTVAQLKAIVERLCLDQHENVVAEIARDKAVAMSGYDWPSPNGRDPLGRLRAAVADASPMPPDALEAAILEAEKAWTAAMDMPLRLVRGKRVLGKFASEASTMMNGRVLIEAVARHRPKIAALADFSEMVRKKTLPH